MHAEKSNQPYHTTKQKIIQKKTSKLVGADQLQVLICDGRPGGGMEFVRETIRVISNFFC